MNFPKLYQKDSSGNTKNWSIEVINHDTHSEILSISGLINGAQTPNSTIINVGKGKKTHFEQACSEAQSKFNAKIKKGYVEDINNVQDSNILGSGMKEPMLAKKYHVTGKQSSSKTLEQIGIKGKEVGIQRKKDGNRCFFKDTVLRVRNKETGKVSEILFKDLEGLWKEYEVYSYNEKTGNFEFCEIQNYLKQNLDKKWLEIVLEDETKIKCTEDHQWLTQRGWVKTKGLTEQDEIISQ